MFKVWCILWFYYKFAAELFYRIFRSRSRIGKVMAKKLLASSTLALQHCPTKR